MLYTYWFFKDQYGKYAEKKAVFLKIPDSGCLMDAKKMYKKPYDESENVYKNKYNCAILPIWFLKNQLHLYKYAVIVRKTTQTLCDIVDVT